MIGKEDPDVIYLIDYGMSQSYLTHVYNEGSKKEKLVHREKVFLNSFSGNYKFASINSCKGMSKSRRDDIESAIYLLIYLLNDQ